MEDVYSRLQKHLDTFGLSAPESEALLKVLRIRFTPEEAEIALLLGQARKDIITLAESSGLAEHGLHSIYEEMARKKLICKQQKKINGVTREVYGLLPTVTDLLEASFAKRKLSDG